VPFAEVVGMVMRGELRDSLTVAGVLKVDRLLRDGALSLRA